MGLTCLCALVYRAVPDALPSSSLRHDAMYERLKQTVIVAPDFGYTFRHHLSRCSSVVGYLGNRLPGSHSQWLLWEITACPLVQFHKTGWFELSINVTTLHEVIEYMFRISDFSFICYYYLLLEMWGKNGRFFFRESVELESDACILKGFHVSS